MSLHDIFRRIQNRLSALDLSPRAASLAAGLSADAIRNIERNVESGKGQGVSSHTIERLSGALKVSPSWLLTGKGDDAPLTVPLRGKVGAGAEIFVFDDDQPMDYVEAPPEISENTAALEIDGDSMFPVYEDKTLIYYSKMIGPAEMVNRRCVVKLTNGKLLVKKLRPGTSPQVWNLESFNPAFPTLEDQTLEWVAKIDWVKER